jgi:hypothetical protein
MDNKKIAISRVPAFINRAVELGCYNKSQKYNIETAWTVLQKVLPLEGLSLDSSVEQVQPKIDDLLDHHGRQSPASAETLRAYKSRLKKLLAEFVEYNGSDFLAWKKKLDKPPANGDTKPRKSRKASRKRSTPDGSEDDVDTITHRLIAGEGKEGKIIIPSDLSKEQIDRIWAQLNAIKTLIKAQIGIVDSESK